jgi:hypothetical protein
MALVKVRSSIGSGPELGQREGTALSIRSVGDVPPASHARVKGPCHQPRMHVLRVRVSLGRPGDF